MTLVAGIHNILSFLSSTTEKQTSLTLTTLNECTDTLMHSAGHAWAVIQVCIMVISLELCFLMEPPKPTKLPSFIAERMSLLAENRSFSNILRRSYFSTGHLRQCMSPDLPASFSLSKYKPAKRKKKKLTLEIAVWPQIKYSLVQKTPLLLLEPKKASWWLSSEESACQCRKHSFNP